MGVSIVMEFEADMLNFAPHPARQRVHKLRLTLCTDTLVYGMMVGGSLGVRIDEFPCRRRPKGLVHSMYGYEGAQSPHCASLGISKIFHASLELRHNQTCQLLNTDATLLQLVESHEASDSACLPAKINILYIARIYQALVRFNEGLCFFFTCSACPQSILFGTASE